MRIDDLDPPREMKGAADSILRTLDRYGLHWDGEVVYQSQHNELYENALRKLNSRRLLYQCTCSRKQIKQTASPGILGYIYPGTCRPKAADHRSYEPCKAVITRLNVGDETIGFKDLLQGNIEQNLASQIGDIVLKRADGFYAYHLAVVVDDWQQNITEIVRGIDLLPCTPLQIYLRKLLYPSSDLPGNRTYNHVHYCHLPVLVNLDNEKLSKQTRARPVSLDNIEDTLFTLLTYLQQNPPATLKQATKASILEWAIDNWCVEKIVEKKQIRVD